MSSEHDKLAELLNLAREINSAEPNSLDNIDQIEKYCSSLAQWLKETENSSSHPNADTLGLSAADLTELSKLHGSVMQLASQLLGNTATQLQDLQIKAKGIMAYVDTLPKKISVTKSRKG